MSRGSSRRKPAKRAAPTPAPGERPPLAVLAVTAVVLVAAIAVAVWWRAKLVPAPASRPVARVSAMPLDSVRIVAGWFEAANARGDWPEALRLAERLAATLPANSLAIRQLALAEHNLRNPLPSPRHGQRPMLRSSLDRARAEARTVALLDSASRVAVTPGDRARAFYWLGKVREYQGLSLDALAAYEAALGADPQEVEAMRAAAAVAAGLRFATSSGAPGRH